MFRFSKVGSLLLLDQVYSLLERSNSIRPHWPIIALKKCIRQLKTNIFLLPLRRRTPSRVKRVSSNCIVFVSARTPERLQDAPLVSLSWDFFWQRKLEITSTWFMEYIFVWHYPDGGGFNVVCPEGLRCPLRDWIGGPTQSGPTQSTYYTSSAIYQSLSKLIPLRIWSIWVLRDLAARTFESCEFLWSWLEFSPSLPPPFSSLSSEARDSNYLCDGPCGFWCP